jgi:hypothetical protein
MLPLVILHAAVMYGVVVFNLAFPKIDRLPIATYGVVVPLAGLEVGVLEFVLGWFRPIHLKAQKEIAPESDS